MNEVLGQIEAYLREHWIELAVAVASMAVGWFLGKRRARAQWKTKEFYHRLNISLNILHPGQPLRIRTVIEKGCNEIFLNEVAVEAVASAARKTTLESPVLPLPDNDYWYYLNAVLNEIAEAFAFGEIKRDLGQPVLTERYVICLTSEAAGEVRQRKVRAMLIQKKVLDHLPDECPPLESPHHSVRWKTLQILAEVRKKHPGRFLEVEISI